MFNPNAKPTLEALRRRLKMANEAIEAAIDVANKRGDTSRVQTLNQARNYVCFCYPPVQRKH